MSAPESKTGQGMFEQRLRDLHGASLRRLAVLAIVDGKPVCGPTP